AASCRPSPRTSSTPSSASSTACARPGRDAASRNNAVIAGGLRPPRIQGERRMIRKLSLAAAATLLVASPALADTWVIDKNHSEAGFQVRHMMSKVRGHFNDYAGTIVVDPAKPEMAAVEFTIKAAS